MAATNEEDRRRSAEKKDDLVDTQDIEQRDKDARDGRHRTFDRPAAQAPEGLNDDPDQDRLHTVERPSHRRDRAVGDVSPGQDQRGRHAGEDERRAAGQTSAPPGPDRSQMDGHFSRVGPGDEIRGPDDIQEALLVDPTAPPDRLVVHQRDIDGRSAEAESPELEEQESGFCQSVP